MRTAVFLGVLAVILGVTGTGGAEVTSGTAQPPASAVRRSGSWLVEETANFQICRPAGHTMKPGMAEAFEMMRATLSRAWQPDAAATSWNPKCHVVIHARVEGYLKAVGPGASQTTGSSLINFDKDRVILRQIDLRGDRADWFAEAFAHELTHIVMADRFVQVPIPHWADEGMAIQADPVAKQRLYGDNLDAALAARREFRLAELLTLDTYPHPSRMGTFYGQSASLVQFFTRIGTKEQLVNFVDLATSRGYDAALREVYSIQGVGALEQQWRRHLRRGTPADGAISRTWSDGRSQGQEVVRRESALTVTEVSSDDFLGKDSLQGSPSPPTTLVE